ncbi:hypothetical protein ACCT08_36580, partial [Rhizobium johnstonii]
CLAFLRERASDGSGNSPRPGIEIRHAQRRPSLWRGVPSGAQSEGPRNGWICKLWREIMLENPHIARISEHELPRKTKRVAMSAYRADNWT